MNEPNGITTNAFTAITELVVSVWRSFAARVTGFQLIARHRNGINLACCEMGF